MKPASHSHTESQSRLVMAEERTKEKLIPRALMAESPNGGSTTADTTPDLDGSNPLQQSDCSACPSPPTKTTEADGNGIGGTAKSCKGCLYYSTGFKADSRGPLCLGLSRSLPNAPEYITAKPEEEAAKDGKTLLEFRYACVGYSLYKDRKDQASAGQRTQTELPFCVGLEVLVDRKIKNADSVSAPAHIHSKDGNGLPQRGLPKPTNATGDEFYSRFTRSANLVANGVAKNIRRVGNQIKQSLDDIMYRRPK